MIRLRVKALRILSGCSPARVATECEDESISDQGKWRQEPSRLHGLSLVHVHIRIYHQRLR